MELSLTTPALLFPALSLLLLAYTNRFLHLSSLIRQLHRDYHENKNPSLRAQIDNLRKRVTLIRWMQLHGALSLALCVASMVAIIANAPTIGFYTFGAALVFMGISLLSLIAEILMSGGALRILLNEVEEKPTKSE